ncbi:maleate cis-trans isomerase family protein [Rhodoplanes serenus]|jgi:arylmalonate decarboxylase|uniref:maleate cis-trans isomerase family protein n=1 Tax=Rhodoplanes serenus TaxID=200615 RepID=UPI000DAD3D07|nr:aspartate/glutamate racemase family protein [Rhodoplanes serenus]MBI5114583.1 aspartate/glutamate racemase family protein [Rhodovulum sp.]RAI35183.1 decarboxylase [Rhodoplanes serenus]
MKALDLNRPYGWRAKIGLITPSSNNINEPEFYRLAPRGVTIHTARVLLTGEMDEDSFFRMARDLGRAAGELATAEVDIVAFGCTAGSVVCPLDALTRSMAEQTGTPAIVTAGAVVSALRALGAKRVAMGTPYVDFVNRREVEFLGEYGIAVTRYLGLEMGHNQADRRNIGHVSPQAIYRMACEIDSPDADAIFISCANLATLDVIEDIEQALGKPVVSSNTACFWTCLRVLGVNSPIAGYGRLLRDLTAPLAEPAWRLAD